MKRFLVAILTIVVTSSAALAWVFNPPGVELPAWPLTQSINCRRDGAEA